MKVFITGGTGFVGSHVVRGVLDAGHEVQLLTRSGAERKLPEEVRKHPGFSVYDGNVLNPATLTQAGKDCEAVIHLIGIIVEDPDDGVTFDRLHVDATRNVIDIARRIGAKRFLHMSALGTREQADANYHRSKYRAESLVKECGIPYVIFRPSLIFGKGDDFIHMQQAFIHSAWPVVIPGNGENLFQPVAIETVVEGFVKALTDDKALNKIFEVGGPSRVSFNQLVDMIAKAKGVAGHIKIHLPIWIMKQVAGVMHGIWAGFPVSPDQITMLQEDNICDSRAFYTNLNLSARDFTVEAIKRCI